MMRSVMMMSLAGGGLAFEPELEVEPPVLVFEPELEGAAGPDVGVDVEPVGVGVSPPVAPVGAPAVADILRQRRVRNMKKRDQRGQSRGVRVQEVVVKFTNEQESP